MYEIYEKYKHFRKIHFTLKKIGFSLGMALIMSLGYLNYLLISDYNALRNNQRNVEAQNVFTISDNKTTGKITAENNIVKVVWHYKTLPEEYSNRGGGNIYELYDKRSDPAMTKNMVGVNNFGEGGTHSALTGIGGLGVTSIWDHFGYPATGDNGVYTTLVAKESYISGQTAVVNYQYIVRSNTIKDASGKLVDDYIITKNWKVSNSVITLNVKTEMLRDARISEPRISFNFKRNYWDTAEILGHDMLWPNQNCEGLNTNGFANPNNTTTTWDLNDPTQDNICYQTKHAQSLLLKSNKYSDINLKIDNNGKGFESGGMFNYGYSLWGTEKNHMTTEFVLGICGRDKPNSGIPDGAMGATDLHWVTWWGGAPPQENRYKDVKASDIFMDDTFKIEITAPTTVHPPQPPSSNPPPIPSSSQDSLSSTGVEGGQNISQEGESSSGEVSAIPEDKSKGITEKVAGSIANIFEESQKAIDGTPLWQKQVLLALLLTVLTVEMIVIDKFVHVSKWLMYVYWHYIKRVY